MHDLLCSSSRGPKTSQDSGRCDTAAGLCHASYMLILQPCWFCNAGSARHCSQSAAGSLRLCLRIENIHHTAMHCGKQLPACFQSDTHLRRAPQPPAVLSMTLQVLSTRQLGAAAKPKQPLKQGDWLHLVALQPFTAVIVARAPAAVVIMGTLYSPRASYRRVFLQPYFACRASLILIAQARYSSHRHRPDF